MAEKILVVDDDLDTLKLVGMMLQRQGYNIVAAINGAQALSKVPAEKPDLILLDVMMPDIDGFEVCKRIRSDPSYAGIPILMFTAKTQVDDKVQGFESGADDYLPKPTHPAELLAHVKALLGRSRVSPTATTVPVKRARTICMIGAKGGLGASTLTVNIAITMATRKQDVILLELRPGVGIAGALLGINKPSGLTALLQQKPNAITPEAVEKELVSHPSGLRALLASAEPHDYALITRTAQIEAIAHCLAAATQNLIIDLGNGLTEATAKLLMTAEHVIVLVEPMRQTVVMAKALITDLETLGLAKSRIDFILVNRERSSLQMARTKIDEMLGQPAMGMITPAPELAYQSAESGVPIVVRDANAMVSDQIRQITDRVMAKAHR
ncbi:MAG: response regulator [Anaerolineales bacterium]